jgi:ABC-type bacteriocin/lantibiotic exporter with double-glycine peptidase domain
VECVLLVMYYIIVAIIIVVIAVIVVVVIIIICHVVQTNAQLIYMSNRSIHSRVCQFINIFKDVFRTKIKKEIFKERSPYCSQFEMLRGNLQVLINIRN